jgi:hypothetical protein
MRTVDKLRAHPGRYLAILVPALAVAAATTVTLASGFDEQPGPGVSRPTTSVPSGSTHPEPGTPAAAATASPTHGHPAATGGTPDPAAATPTMPGHPATGTRPPLSTTPPASSAPGAAEPDDLLKRNEPLPAGVPEQVEFFLGGGDQDCTGDAPAGSPQIGGVPPVVEIPVIVHLCIYGFDLAKPPAVTVTHPSGLVTTAALRADGDYLWTAFSGLPGDPIGMYIVTAVQGKLEAAVKFELRHASSPRISLVWPVDPAPAGADFDLYLGGFPANQPTPMHLYDYATGQYRTSFTVAVDPIGEAHVVIDTKPDDPLGCYGLISGLAHKPGEVVDTVLCVTQAGV